MNVLGIFVKEPIAGRVKTRLASSIGDANAAALYGAMTADIVDRLSQTADERILCFTPNTTSAREHFLSVSEGTYQIVPQPIGDLGNRQREFFKSCFLRGAKRVIVIGSDSPLLPAKTVDAAFTALGESRAVIGPSLDGGYYLLGMAGEFVECFADVPWSTGDVFRVVEKNLNRATCPPCVLETQLDVDDADSLRMLRDRIEPGCRHTFAALGISHFLNPPYNQPQE